MERDQALHTRLASSNFPDDVPTWQAFISISALMTHYSRKHGAPQNRNTKGVINHTADPLKIRHSTFDEATFRDMWKQEDVVADSSIPLLVEWVLWLKHKGFLFNTLEQQSITLLQEYSSNTILGVIHTHKTPNTCCAFFAFQQQQKIPPSCLPFILCRRCPCSRLVF